MIVEITKGLLTGPPEVLRASQILIRQGNGTLLAVAALIGDGGIQISRCTDDDWPKVLKELGIHERTEVTRLELAVPADVKLLRRA